MIRSSLYLCIVILCVYLRRYVAEERHRHFAGFRVVKDGSSVFPGLVPQLNDHVYLAYYNTVHGINNDEITTEEEGNLVPDNVQPGLSILSFPKSDADKVSSGRASYVESCCMALTAISMSGRLPGSANSKGSSCSLGLFYRRCLGLNGQLVSDVDTQYASCLSQLPKGITIGDVYLFEKWARQCPKPLYADDAELQQKAKSCHSAFKGAPSAKGMTDARHCFLNDVLGVEWVPYAEVHRESATSKIIPNHSEADASNHPRMWQYQHMPKVAEFALGIPDAVTKFYKVALKKSQNAKAKAISKFLESHATDIRLRYMTLAIINRSGEQRTELSFGISFSSPEDAAMPEFDFVAPEKVHGCMSASVLGTVEPLIAAEAINAQLMYSQFAGEGQHRWMTVTATINVLPLKRLLGFPEKIYLKVAHMFDSNVYLDNDELNQSFQRLESEAEVTGLHSSKVDEGTDAKTGLADIHTIRTQFINVEDPEMRSSPLIWYGYIALDTWSLSYDRVQVRYRLPVHLRYVYMNKGMTREVADAARGEELSQYTEGQYATVMLSEPMLFVLNTKNSRYGADEDITPLVESYIAFRRRVSFLNLVAPGSKETTKGKPVQRLSWRRVYITKRDSAYITGASASVCNPDRSGLAFVTRSFSVERCPKTNKSALTYKGQQAYVVFTAPRGDYRDFPVVFIVTVVVTVVAALVSLTMVRKSMAELFDKRKMD
ncbi:uncharacterized protein BXIN_0619 [Babesia sp. Xinjiang]|uniref:uncharacterized protein n=1 Tax=Babesia sp. Xinjiang TaxID=462227 RepID=UPI000A24DFDB|nr:uncharacterized protein BXIN_0619 [Babesia sp. Xinjiang]ORM41801.1 hypothetical protein BXIN_0619 [Babesia sp. Xinjiang]